MNRRDRFWPAMGIIFFLLGFAAFAIVVGLPWIGLVISSLALGIHAFNFANITGGNQS